VNWEKKLQKIIEFYPHKGQKEVLKCGNKEVAICAGRRWGKSAIAGYIVAREFLKGLLKVKKGEKDSYKVWIVAPTYELTQKVFEYVVKFLLKFDRSFSKYIASRPTPQLKMSESVWIQCKSTTEPNSLLGEELDLEIVDEAARIPERIYHQYIYPTTISKSRDCRVYLISTPRGKNWFQKRFYMLKEKKAAFHFTTLDGVETDEERLEEIRKTTPELLFRQEYLAEFVDEAGTVFRNLQEIILPQDRILRDVQPGHRYVMGVDLAEAEDFTAIAIIDKNTNHVVHFDRFQKRDYPLQKEHIIQKARRYNNARVVIDATGIGRPVYEDLRRAGVFVEDFVFSGRSKEELIGKLIVFIEEKYVRIPDIPVLVEELKAFEYQYINPKTGENLKNIKYGAPKGYHDDCVIALALAVWLLNPEKPVVKTPLQQELEKSRIPKKQDSFI